MRASVFPRQPGLESEGGSVTADGGEGEISDFCCSVHTVRRADISRRPANRIPVVTNGKCLSSKFAQKLRISQQQGLTVTQESLWLLKCFPCLLNL